MFIGSKVLNFGITKRKKLNYKMKKCEFLSIEVDIMINKKIFF